MGRAPTIRDVALRAGVSVATASNVVNGVRPVGEASRRKVLEAIAALDYRLDRAASALRGRSTRLVGMVVPDITNVFFASLVHGVEALAERDGYDLLIVSSSEDAAKERRRVEALIARRIDGLIVVPALRRIDGRAQGRQGRLAPPAHGAGRPGRPRRPDSTPCARIARPPAMRRRAASSTSGTGTSRFSPTRSASTISSSASPAAAALLAEAGLDERDRVIYGGDDLESLRGAIEVELNRADRPTAIFALTNVCALASIKAARGLGLEIPRDVSIVGFDDFDWMWALRPYLTTVAQPVDDFASAAWRLLMRRLKGEAESDVERIELPCALKVRELTGPARPRLKAVAEVR